MTIPPDKETVPLWPNGAPGALGDADEDIPAITLYPPATGATGGAIVVLPGGGYGGLADHEAAPVAEWLNSHGIFAAVLQYRLGPKYRHPTMLNDAARALRVVRSNAAAWHIDPATVGILGFSAGGHLASTASVHHELADGDRADPVDCFTSRPDVAILVYPVITLAGEHAHVGSRENLLGTSADADLVRLLSNETAVTASTPPTFLVTATDDEPVPPENSFAYALALSRHKVPYELHAYQTGGHGFGMGTGDPILGRWPDDAAAWLRRYGF